MESNNVLACEEADQGHARQRRRADRVVPRREPEHERANYSFNTGNFVIADATNAQRRCSVARHVLHGPGDRRRPGRVTVVADASGLGAVQQADDWTSPWAFGLDPSNADQPLWFVP